MGEWTQRVVEYPWVLKQLDLIKPGSLVLDVGCSESLFNQILIQRKYSVVGLDYRDNEFPNKYLFFIKRNILDTRLPSEMFDAAIVVSTIEHIGLGAYGQTARDDDGDIHALRQIAGFLKKKGILILTTPYIGHHHFYVDRFERRYNTDRLEKLVYGFRVLKEEYFFPYYHRRLLWLRMNRDEANRATFEKNRPGIACLVLSKR